MSLTQKEKADRYDALQMAIKSTIESRRRQAMEIESLIKDGNNMTYLECFNYGIATQLKASADDLERWI